MKLSKRVTRSRFYVITTQHGEVANTWRWEIRRKWKPIGVNYSDGGFKSQEEAKAAGKIVLEDLLNRLALDLPARNSRR
jgi:hypothetical protein